MGVSSCQWDGTFCVCICEDMGSVAMCLSIGLLHTKLKPMCLSIELFHTKLKPAFPIA